MQTHQTSSKKVGPQRMVARRWWGLTVAAVVGLAGCQAPHRGGDAADPVPSVRYVAVIDAGSSGSRLFLYRAQSAGTPAGGAQITSVYSDRDVPHPLAWYDGQHGPESAPVNAGPLGVEPLLKGLSQRLRAQGTAPDHLTVHVLATAGMRLVAPALAQRIHASVRAAIADHGFAVGEVATITGQEEGLYSWVDVNYLLGRFDADEPPVGVVEVGGASAQVAFAVAGAAGGAVDGSVAGGPTSQAPVARTAVVPLRVRGRTYPVYAATYLGLGQNEARAAMLRGAGAQERCYPHASPQAQGATQFDGEACAAAFAPVLAKAAQGALPRVKEVPGFAQTRFVGLSSVHYAYKDWGLTQGPTELAPTVTEACTGEQAWGRVQQRYRNPVLAYQQHACANGMFLQTLLFGPHGLGLQAGQLQPLAQIAGQEVNWTRGVVVLSLEAAGARVAP